MIASRHPAFAKLSAKIGRAERELRQVEHFVAENGDRLAKGEWGALSAVSLGIHNVYNGIEDVLLSIANDVDGFVPHGPTLHQDLLDQTSVEVAGIRPPLIDPDLYHELSELKGFRHLVRHRYGLDLDPERVSDNVERMRKTFPAFVAAIVQLERYLASEESEK